MEELEIKQRIATGIIEKLKNELGHVQMENKSMETEAKNLKNGKEHVLKESTAEKEKLKIEISRFRNENLILNEKVNEFIQEETQVQDLKAEINALQTEINEKKTVLNKINNENEVLEEKLLFLEERNKELKALEDELKTVEVQ